MKRCLVLAALLALGAAEAQSPKLTGNYYGYSGRMLHTWEFHEDATFLHTWMSSGSGARVRNSERGAYRVSGNVVDLKVASAAGGFVTPGAGGRSTLSGGGGEARNESRRLDFKITDDGLLLDGVKLKPKRW